MNSDIKNLSRNKVKVTVDLDRNDLQKYVNEAENLLGEGVSIKGFRQGKVPKDLAQKHLDQEKVRSVALEMALERSLSEVIREKTLDVLETSELSVEKNDASMLRYSVVLDLFPEVKLIDLNKIKVSKETPAGVSNNEVNSAIETIRNSRATFLDKGDDEPVQTGDRVEVDFEVKTEGRILDGGVSKNHPLIIGGNNFIPGFEDKLIGMAKGESKSFSLIAPSDYFHKEVAGKKLDFDVKVVDIKKVISPDLNDDFAKSLGKFTNFNELFKSVKEGLTQEKSFKESQKFRLAILDRIIQGSQIEVPQNLLDKQLDLMISDFDNTLHSQGLELGLYMAKIGKSQDELKKDWSKDAEKQVKIALVLRKLAKDLKIEASEEEIDEAVGQVIQAAIARGNVDQDSIDPVKIKENVASRIVNEKTMDYLETHCSA